MKREILIGTTLAVIIVLAGFSSIASAQTTKPNEIRSNIFQQIKEKMENKLIPPGEIFGTLLQLFMTIIYGIFFVIAVYFGIR